MINYRAQLFGIQSLERPVQNFSNKSSVLEKWATETIKKYPTGQVKLFVVKEEEIATYVGKTEGDHIRVERQAAGSQSSNGPFTEHDSVVGRSV